MAEFLTRNVSGVQYESSGPSMFQKGTLVSITPGWWIPAGRDRRKVGLIVEISIVTHLGQEEGFYCYSILLGNEIIELATLSDFSKVEGQFCPESEESIA
jgi:hypothetical protein